MKDSCVIISLTSLCSCCVVVIVRIIIISFGEVKLKATVTELIMQVQALNMYRL